MNQNLLKIKSDYFSLDEFASSTTANRLGINNTPSVEVVRNIQYGVSMILDPLRMYVGKPIIITSGFRCPLLNKAVGGVPGSWHLQGNAADIRISSNEDAKLIFEYLKSNVSVDTVLFEHSNSAQWIHVQWDMNRTPRHKSNFNYIAKVLLPLIICFAFFSCKSKQIVTSSSSTSHVSEIKDSSFSQMNEETVIVAFTDTNLNPFSLLPDCVSLKDSSSAEITSNLLKGVQQGVKGVAVIKRKKLSVSSVSEDYDTFNISESVYNTDTKKENSNRHFGAISLFLIAFFCLVVIIAKKVAKKFGDVV